MTHGNLVDATHIQETDGTHRTATIAGSVITWSNGPVWHKLPELSGNWQVAADCDPTYVEQSGLPLLFLNALGETLVGKFTGPTQAQMTQQGLPNPPLINVTIPNAQTLDFGNQVTWKKFPPNLLDDVFADANFWPFL